MFSHKDAYTKDIQAVASGSLDWSRLDGHSVLIVGATGMIGTVMVDVLMFRNAAFSAGIQVWVMSRSEGSLKKRFGEYLENPDFHYVLGDVNTPLPQLGKMDYVFHCASNTHPRAYATDPVGTITTNVIGTKNILDFAREAQATRVVFLSSVEIYGENNTGKEKFSEQDFGYIDCNTLRAGYPEGKRVGEALCQAYMEAYGMDVVIPRICRVYGPTMLESDSKALAQFIRNAANGQDIVLKSDGMQFYSYCYVTDVVSALLTILLRGEKGVAYNIADSRSDVHLRELAGILAELARTQVVFQVSDAVEAKGYSKATKAVLDASRLRELGWQPINDIHSGLKKTLACMK